jgi:hypothetical protein
MSIMRYNEFLRNKRIYEAKTSYSQNTSSEESGFLTTVSTGIADFFKKAEERFKNFPALYNRERFKAKTNVWGSDPASTGFGELVGLAGSAITGTAERVFRPSSKQTKPGDTNKLLGRLNLDKEEFDETYHGGRIEDQLKNAARLTPQDREDAYLDYLRQNPPTEYELETEMGRTDYVLSTVYGPLGTSPGKKPQVDVLGNMALNFYDSRK